MAKNCLLKCLGLTSKKYFMDECQKICYRKQVSKYIGNGVSKSPKMLQKGILA